MNTLLMAFGGWQTIAEVPIWVILLGKVTVMLCVAWAVYFVLKRTNPRWRILLWRATAVGLVTLPTVSWLFPSLNIYVRQPSPGPEKVAAKMMETSTTVSPIEREAGLHPPVAFPSGLPKEMPHETSDNNRGDIPPDASTRNPLLSELHEPPKVAATLTATLDAVTPRKAHAPVVVHSKPKRSSISWPWLLTVVWLGGIVLFVFRLGLGHYRISAFVRRATPAPQTVCEECRLVADSIGCRCHVEVVQSTEIRSPFIFGLFRLRLLLSKQMCETSYRDDLPGILAHELNHVRCHDIFWNLVLELISIVLWFHPLVWRMRKAHLIACEMISDATSASFVGDVNGYCRTLVRVAVEACGTLPASGIAMARTSMIMHRLDLLKKRVFHHPLRRRSVIGFGLATLLAVTVLGTLQFALAEPTKEESTKKTVTASPTSSDENKPSTPFVITLPDGSTVEVLGVCESPSVGKKWWKPDGSPLEKPPYEATLPGSALRVNAGERDVVREVFYRIPESTKKDLWFTTGFKQVGSSSDIAIVAADKSSRSDVRAVAIDRSQSTFSFRVEYADGEWTTNHTTQKGGEVGELFGDIAGYFIVSPATEIKGSAGLTVSYELRDRQLRVVVIDREGHQHEASSMSWSTAGEHLSASTALFAGIPLAEVKEFRIQSRPKHWIELRNISVHPGHRTKAKIVTSEDPMTEKDPETKPAEVKKKTSQAIVSTSHELELSKATVEEKQPNPFTVTLPNGTAVEVLGVCEHPSTGKSWWRPDGSPLARPPYDSTQVKTHVSPREGNVALEVACHVSHKKKDGSRFLISSRHGSGSYDCVPIKTPDGLGVIYPLVFEVKKTQPIGSVRVHYSTDGWTAHRMTRKNGTFVGDGVSIVESKATEANGTISLTISHKMGDCEVRVVAVDLDGRRHKRSKSSSYNATEVLHVTSATFHKLPLAKVKEFHLESRPRRWVELQNISLQPGHKTQAELAFLEKLSPAEIQAADDRDPRLVDFTSLSYSFSPSIFGGPPYQIVIKGNGRCTYSIQGQPACVNRAAWPAGRQDFKLSPQKLQQLENLLAKTDWLTAPGGEGPALHTDAVEVKLVLDRRGKTRSVECLGQRPEPYQSLLGFFDGIAHQEYRIYCLEHRLDLPTVRYELSSELQGLLGVYGQPTPRCDIDYTRYVRFFNRALREPHDAMPEDLVIAVRLMSFLKLESKVKYLTKLTNHHDSHVQAAVAKALNDLIGSDAVPLLAEMVDSTEEARRYLVCMGKPAVPTIVDIISKGQPESLPNDPNMDEITRDELMHTICTANVKAEQLVRAYIDYWLELPGPIDPKVVEAVRQNVQELKGVAAPNQYYEHFLKLVETEPIPEGKLFCHMERGTVSCPMPVRLIHGWYVVDGEKIVKHGTFPTPEAGTKLFQLENKMFPAENRVVLDAGWRSLLLSPDGETVKMDEFSIEGPPGSTFEVVYPDDRFFGSGAVGVSNSSGEVQWCSTTFNQIRLTDEWRTLWEGRFVKDGKVVRRVLRVAKLVPPEDPTREFVPPAKPAPTKGNPVEKLNLPAK